MSAFRSTARSDARDQLAALGAAAMPDVSPLAAVHLRLIEQAVADAAAPTRQVARARRPLPRARRAGLVFAASTLLVLPSMALAGVLPDPLQRAASRAAAVVGMQIPAVDGARPVERAPAGRPAERAADPARMDDRPGRGEQVAPRRPADGELRGNRYGQVPEGPDRGRAANGGAERPPTPARPAAPAPATPPAKQPEAGPGGAQQGGGSQQGAAAETLRS